MPASIDPLDRFERLMHGVQAMRRRVERLSCPIQGGSGVRAQFYPHQIQNVQRILCASRVRHLIADEVGMGKTIEALMVANAIRLQVGRLRVRIIVGESELRSQWVREIASRAHVTPELEHEVVGDDWFHVLLDSSIQSIANALDPGDIDLLILDEPQSLRADVLAYIAEHSREYSHLLLLTATPELRNVRRLCELLQMLEPERIERVRRELDADVLHEDEGWSLSSLRGAKSDELDQVHRRYLTNTSSMRGTECSAVSPPDGVSSGYAQFAEHRRARFLADTRWKYRTVLRAYRKDFPDHLPQRRLRTLSVEPTTPERWRMELAIKYVHGLGERHHEQQDRNAAAELLRRVALGGDSLQARMRELRRGDAEYDPRLAQISELSRKETADSRLDAIVDWLSDFWRHDPRRKVVVAAQDNPTVDELAGELSWRLPEVGRRGKRLPLQIATARAERDVVDHTAGEGLATSQLREFEAGDAQLLVAHDSFRQSYNLQAAEALVFYSLPWTPEWVDQWIGRVDRLGRDFVNPENRRSPPKAVRIVTLHRMGDPTEVVEQVFHTYRVFTCALAPDQALLHAISDDVYAAGLGWKSPDASSPSDPYDPAADEANETTPPSGSHWTVERAVELFDELLDRPIPEPRLRHTESLGYVSCEEEVALASWISLLGRHKIISIRKFRKKGQDNDSRSRTFFTLGQSRGARPRIVSLDDRTARFPPFFISRRNIQRPPRLEVNTRQDGESELKVLQFLSHGSPLHEELIATFMEAGRCETPLGIRLFGLGDQCYPEGTDLRAGTYLGGVGFVDSAFKYAALDATAVLAEPAGSDDGARITEMRQIEVARLRAGLEADARLVRILAPTSSSCLAWRITDTSQAAKCSPREASDLFAADWAKQSRPIAEPFRPPWAGELPPTCARHIASDAKEFWAPSYEQIRERIEERAELIRVEAEDTLWNLRSSRGEVLKRIEALTLASTEHNEQTIRLTYRPRLALFEEQMELTQRACQLRCAKLQETLEHLREPDARSVYLQATAVVDLQPEPVLDAQNTVKPPAEVDGNR